jgi:hypothetical protein
VDKTNVPHALFMSGKRNVCAKRFKKGKYEWSQRLIWFKHATMANVYWIPHSHQILEIDTTPCTTLWSSAHLFMWASIENITMGCPNLVQGDSEQVCICTRLGHPTIQFSRPTNNERTLLNNV